MKPAGKSGRFSVTRLGSQGDVDRYRGQSAVTAQIRAVAEQHGRVGAVRAGESADQQMSLPPLWVLAQIA
jgi:hypothetical protein